MQHEAAHKAFLCSGQPWPAHGGSWIGHVLPGVVLSLWGLHWFISATHQRLAGMQKQPAGAAHHRIVFLPGAWQGAEPWLKIVLPAIAIVLEFTLSGTTSLRCPSSTAKSGELDVAHMNSWSHATNYPPIMLSGLVDLIHTHWEPLPEGETHLQPYLGGPPVLSSAFGSSAFLMLSHTKGQPLDALLHQLLGYCMAAAALAILAQGLMRWQSYVLDAARSLAVILEGCWFLAIAHILLSNDTMWAVSHARDMTPVMFTPVLFAWIAIGLSACLLAVYMAMHALLMRRQQLVTYGDRAHHINCGHDVSGHIGHFARYAHSLAPDAGSRCSADSCCDWVFSERKPWRYIRLGETLSAEAHQQHHDCASPGCTAAPAVERRHDSSGPGGDADSVYNSAFGMQAGDGSGDSVVEMM